MKILHLLFGHLWDYVLPEHDILPSEFDLKDHLRRKCYVCGKEEVYLGDAVWVRVSKS